MLGLWKPGSAEQRQPVCHNPEAAAIEEVTRSEIHISHEHVCRHALKTTGQMSMARDTPLQGGTRPGYYQL